MIVLPVEHRLAARETIEIADLAGERYVQRSFCEFNDMVDRVFDDRGIDCETVYRSDRDDWVLAMIARRLRIFSEIFDLKCSSGGAPLGQSRVLARGQPHHRQGPSLLARGRRAGT